jgi:hypothetical protein
VNGGQTLYVWVCVFIGRSWGLSLIMGIYKCVDVDVGRGRGYMAYYSRDHPQGVLSG